MAAAFLWGALAASSLVIGALIALVVPISHRWIGLIMAFGAGVLISAVAFDLVEEAATIALGTGWLGVGIAAGCGVFFVGDWLIGRLGGGDRKDPTGAQAGSSSLAIVLGTVLDGIPESLVIGLTLRVSGGIGVAYLVAVFISNLPEAVSSTAGLIRGGWRTWQVLGLWISVMLISGLSSLVGYVAFQNASPETVAFVLTFAAGAILTMLADTMMPEAFENGGLLAGVFTTLGFAVAFEIHVIAHS
jgi:ZIP family zinc transporter